MRVLWLVFGIIGLAVLALGWKIIWGGPVVPKAAPPPSVELVNGDFEADEPDPWHSLEGNLQWGPFSLGSETTAEGKTNHFAKVRAEASAPPVSLRVFGTVQELVIRKGLPEKLDFRCRVAQEKKLCSKQYAQAVAIFTPASGTNVQLRHILHGVDTPPYQMGNARFVMNPAFQEKDGWRHYSLPLREKFAQEYPGQDFTKGTLRLLFEARYDDLPSSVAPGEVPLEMHYDDVRADL